MPKNIFHNEIDLLLERLRRKHDSLKKIEGRPPRLDVDIMLSDLRTLYEFCHELANLPDEFLSASTPLENTETSTVAAAPVAEESIPAPTPEVKAPENVSQPAPEATSTPAVDEAPVKPEVAPTPSVEKTESTLFNPLAEARTNTIVRTQSTANSVRDRYEDTPTLNDQLTMTKPKNSVAADLKLKPISDIRKAIGINEKFIFARDLFNGNTPALESALESINKCADHAAAELFIAEGPAATYNWKSQNKFVRADFMELVQRRFL